MKPSKGNGTATEGQPLPSYSSLKLNPFKKRFSRSAREMFSCSDSEVNPLPSILATDHLNPEIFRCQLPHYGAKSGDASAYEKASLAFPDTYLGVERVVAGELLGKFRLECRS
jgi:hypothetical protein